MKKNFYKAMKAYLRKELLLCRAALKISQEEMAHRLLISVRAYASLEAGKSCCSLITVALFLRRCCPDRCAFIDGLLAIFEPAESDVA